MSRKTQARVTAMREQKKREENYAMKFRQPILNSVSQSAVSKRTEEGHVSSITTAFHAPEYYEATRKREMRESEARKEKQKEIIARDTVKKGYNVIVRPKSFSTHLSPFVKRDLLQARLRYYNTKMRNYEAQQREDLAFGFGTENTPVIRLPVATLDTDRDVNSITPHLERGKKQDVFIPVTVSSSFHFETEKRAQAPRRGQERKDIDADPKSRSHSHSRPSFY